jgi:hypothetical protein
VSKPRLVLILGSGFSKEAGVPTTAELSSEFLKNPRNSVFLSGPELEDCITAALKEFWIEVFGYEDGATPPTLEDHFTILDLAANSGHHLGINWPPKRLRAIRRFSIHRVFQILDTAMKPAPAIDSLFTSIAEKFEFSIVTLNWDIVCENRLPDGVDYGIRVGKLETSPVNTEGTLLLKLHGSSNWLYCDNCRRISAGSQKSALHEKAFLEPSDFKLFNHCIRESQRDLGTNRGRLCGHCNNQVGGRVATFSFKKDLAIAQFQTIWNRAFEELSKAKYWLLIGYSMPQADYEFRHLLKSAQKARNLSRDGEADIRAISLATESSDGGRSNYERFFGSSLKEFHDQGLSHWVDNHMVAYCLQNGGRP